MKLIGIIGAMEVEVASLKEMMTDVTIRTKASMEFNHGYLNGKEVVVVRSGIGKVNAGICTQILVDDYGVDCVINTGIAGSLRNEINIGDIVISTDAVQHDMDVRIFGYPLGEIPQMGVLSFPADEHLAEVAEEVCKKVNPEIQVFRGRAICRCHYCLLALPQQQAGLVLERPLKPESMRTMRKKSIKMRMK